MAEAATWLVRDAKDFTARPILLQEVKNVTYKSFVRPGNLLTLDVTCRRLGDEKSDFSGIGRCGDTEVVRGRFSLGHRADLEPVEGDGRVQTQEMLQSQFAMLQR